MNKSKRKKVVFDNFEIGTLQTDYLIRGKIGRPKKIKVVFGRYTKIGKIYNIYLCNGMSICGKLNKEK